MQFSSALREVRWRDSPVQLGSNFDHESIGALGDLLKTGRPRIVRTPHVTASERVWRVSSGTIPLEKFAKQRLEEPYPYLILDARYEKVREDGAVRSQAVLVAIGINWEDKGSVLAEELASRESLSSWRELLTGLRGRSLHGG